MNQAYPNLLSKDEIIKLLIERQLNIPNIKSMTYNEVLNVYNKYALPLSMRERRKTHSNAMDTDYENVQMSCHDSPVPQSSSCNSKIINSLETTRKGHKRILPPTLDTVECENKIRKLKLVVDAKQDGFKRPIQDEKNFINNLALKSKRKKITWC